MSQPHKVFNALSRKVNPDLRCQAAVRVGMVKSGCGLLAYGIPDELCRPDIPSLGPVNQGGTNGFGITVSIFSRHLQRKRQKLPHGFLLAALCPGRFPAFLADLPLFILCSF